MQGNNPKKTNPAGGRGLESVNHTTQEVVTMNMLTLSPQGSQTMSSREIAELTGKEHKNVIRDIRQMLDSMDGSILSHEEYQEVKDSRGYTSEFLLNKNLTLTLMTGYDVNTRHKINVRWQELESTASQSVLNPANLSRLQLIEMAMQAEQERLVLEHKVETMQPDVDAYTRLAKAEGSLCITDAAKGLGMGQKALHKWLSAHDWIYRRNGNMNWLGYSDKEKAGYLEHKVMEQSLPDGSTRIREQVRITPKGLTVLAKQIQVGEAA